MTGNNVFERIRAAGLDKQPAPRPPVLAVVRAPTDSTNAYALKAFNDECDIVANAVEGAPGRNITLNNAALKLGTLVASGELNEGDVVNALTNAAVACGLHTDTNGMHGIAATIASGLAKGKQSPRVIPPRAEIAPAFTMPETMPGTTGSVGNGTAGNTDIGADPVGATEAVGAWVEANLPRIDWRTLWEDDTEQEWIVEPLIPARRIVALYSPAKTGKSLLMLELAAGVAAGRKVLGQDVTPRVVLYVDFENDPRDDVRTRLISMGYRWDDLDNLVYLSYPTLSALDSEAGGKELLAAVNHYGAECVVIDTISRAVDGEENDNNTWLKAYRHTLLLLKQAGVAAIRLDHTGKDEDKGQRGGSAKTGDVDAVWKLSVVDEFQLKLHCDIARMPIAEHDLVLIRNELPHLHHSVDRSSSADQFEAKVAAVVVALDRAGLPPDAGRRAARAAISITGVAASNGMLDAACKRRKSSAATSHWQDE
jgi:hypothetical protein